MSYYRRRPSGLYVPEMRGFRPGGGFRGGRSIQRSAGGTVVAPPPGGYTIDLTQLPVAAGVDPDTTAYAALGVASLAAGDSYADPYTGINVVKVTDASTPITNTFMTHDYSGGSVQISRQWGGNKHTLYVYRQAAGTHYFVDYTYGGTLSNWRLAPSATNDLSLTFSKAVATPRICFYQASSTLNRYDTSTDALANTGNFPKSSWSPTSWLQNDELDDWFVGLASGTVYAWQSSVGGAVISQAPSGVDEPYFSHDGARVYIVRNAAPNYTNTIWTLAGDTTADYQHTVRTFHATALYDYVTGQDVDSGSPTELHRTQLSTGTFTQYDTNIGGYQSGYHSAGQWLQSGQGTAQYYLHASENPTNDTSNFGGAICFARIDGADYRVLCHAYNAGNGARYYQDFNFGTISPDGFLVMFTSNMNNASGRADIFVAETPRTV